MDIYDLHNYLKDDNSCEIGIDAKYKVNYQEKLIAN